MYDPIARSGRRTTRHGGFWGTGRSQSLPTTWRLAVTFQLSGPEGRLPTVRQVQQGAEHIAPGAGPAKKWREEGESDPTGYGPFGDGGWVHLARG
eukprot:5014852-Prymnesium_polylepis.1